MILPFMAFIHRDQSDLDRVLATKDYVEQVKFKDIFELTGPFQVSRQHCVNVATDNSNTVNCV